jgi:hypothetical protein
LTGASDSVEPIPTTKTPKPERGIYFPSEIQGAFIVG